MKRIVLVVSIVLGSLRSDPGKFVQNLRELLRRRGLRLGPNRLAVSEQPESIKLESNGEYSKVVELLGAKNRLSTRDKRQIRRIQNAKYQLELEPIKRPSHSVYTSKENIRVLYFLTNSIPYTHSGYTQRSHMILKAVCKAGVKIVAVTRLAYPVVIGNLKTNGKQEIDGITYRRLLPWLYPTTSVGRLRKSTKLLVDLGLELEPTILHTTTNFVNATVVNRAAAILGIPWIYEVRGELEKTWLSQLPKSEQYRAQKSYFYIKARAQETKYSKAADAVIVLSHVSKNQLVARGVEEKKIHVVPNAINPPKVDPTFDKEEFRAKFGVSPGTVLIGSITSIVEYEGLDIAIKCLEFLPDKYRLLIVGDGVHRPNLEGLVAKLGLSKRVFFAGRRPLKDITDWYAALDIFILPRKDTPVCRTITPIKALNAQALGIPVVASDLPALREVTGDVEFYSEPENPSNLAATVLAAKAHNRGMQWASSRTWDKSAEQLLQVYEEVVSSSGKDFS